VSVCVCWPAVVAFDILAKTEHAATRTWHTAIWQLGKEAKRARELAREQNDYGERMSWHRVRLK